MMTNWKNQKDHCIIISLISKNLCPGHAAKLTARLRRHANLVETRVKDIGSVVGRTHPGIENHTRGLVTCSKVLAGTTVVNIIVLEQMT